MTANSENFNDDELVAPDWLDKDFFSKVLQHSEKNSALKVRSFQISPATEKGDHYASIMFRARIDYKVGPEVKTKSLIVKIMPEEDGTKKELLKETGIFEIEIAMYTKVIPRFERILREIGDPTVLQAPCLYHSLAPHKIIVFEDLVPLGYTVLRHKPITLEEMKCAYSKLAKWHAIAFKLLKEDPDFFTDFRFGILSLESFSKSPFFSNGIKYFHEFLQNEPSLAKFAKYFENLDEAVRSKAAEGFTDFWSRPKENFLYTLCHGDFHLKNIMVKYNPENGQFEDLLPVDFQVCYVGPIHNDLSYALYMMLGEDLRFEKMDELLYHYHQVFKETLQKIGCKALIPPLIQLRQQIVQDPCFELFIFTTFLPFWLKLREGDCDLQKFMQCPENQKEFYRNEVLVKEVRKMLPRYLHLGYLEDLPKN